MDDFLRYLGIDHGDKRIGVAVSDPLRLTARPLTIIENTSDDDVMHALATIIQEQDVSKIVVGLPTDSQSEIGFQAQRVIDWCCILTQTVSQPIVFWDETSSSVSVSARGKQTKRKQFIDDQAAAAILQDYLIASQGAVHEPGQPLSSIR